MYRVLDKGVLKKIETWQSMIPVRDNEGKSFERSTLDSILSDITLNFPGMTVVSCAGYWRSKDRVYVDDNLQVLIDALPTSSEEAAAFFAGIKTRPSNPPWSREDLRHERGIERGVYFIRRVSEGCWR
jgi:hypothetical protein